MQPVKPMDVCRVISDKKLKGSGLERGDVLLIISETWSQATRSDPYLQRKWVKAALFKDGEVQIPNPEKNEYVAYLLDPRSLEQVSEEEKAEFDELINIQYGRSS